jgi:hypothetical protein
MNTLKTLGIALLLSAPLNGIAQTDPTSPFTLRSWAGATTSNQTGFYKPYRLEVGQRLELNWAVSNINKPYIFIVGWSDNDIPPVKFGEGLPARGTARWTPNDSFLPNPWTSRRVEIMLFARINQKDFWQRAYVNVIPRLPSIIIPDNPPRDVKGQRGHLLTATVGVPFSFTPPLPSNAWRPEQMPYRMEYPWNVPHKKKRTEWEKTPWLTPRDMGTITTTDFPSRTGRVTGTPNKPGLYKYTFVIRNDGHQLVQNFFIDVKPKAPTIPQTAPRAADLINR